VAWSGGRKFSVPIPPDEKQRLRDLRRYEVLDTSPDESLDHLAQLAAHICQTPIALISLVDADRQWFKARVGLDISETPRDIALCAHAIMDRRLFEVPDLRQDERFADNPLVVTEPGIRFYAGEPLVTPDNHAIGTLCVIDRVPRKLSAEQEGALRVLARQVMAQFELRRQLLEAKSALRTSRREVKKLRNDVNLLTSARARQTPIVRGHITAR
jgi:GAF domain-containing protein